MKRDSRHDHDCGHDHDHAHDHDDAHDCGHDHDHDSHFLSTSTGSQLADGTEIFSGHGVQFRYPSNWSLQDESNPEQTTISVQSPGTAFWMLTIFEDRPDPERIAASVVATYEELYDDLDIYEPDIQVLGSPAVAREIDFVCLDLVSTAALIVFQTMNHTILINFQGEDQELTTARPILESITQSLMCDPE